MSRNEISKGKIILGILALISIIPYRHLPKVLQDLKNILESVNPLKRLWDRVTSITLEEAEEKLAKGDHIYVYHTLYSHHGIYAGDGNVWEYDGLGENARIRLSTLDHFAKGSRINKLNYAADFDEDEIVSRAQSRGFEQEYSLMNNNCMHYALWCRLSSPESVKVMEQALLLLDEGKGAANA